MNTQSLSHVSIVLINTSHPGNIGSVARAMKTMGLEKLVLVSPKSFPSIEADALASGAKDVLDNAKVYNDIADALAPFQKIYGTSARSRTLSIVCSPVREVSQSIANEKDKDVAIIFGRERTGLTNDELAMCDAHVHIPTNPDYGSLNLAQAVQIVAYELSQSTNLFPVIGESKKASRDKAATRSEIDALIMLIECKLHEKGHFTEQTPKRTMHRVRRLFNKATLTQSEVKLMCGVIKQISNH